MPTEKEAMIYSGFSYNTIEEIMKVCIDFYQKHLQTGSPEVIERRKQLAKFIRVFHQKCGTLTSDVEKSIENLENSSCLVLMTAHQPNLFAYSGILRKATLNHSLASKISEICQFPVVSFYGLADQDFVDDRWLKTAQLPDVERRNGILELKFYAPKKIVLNHVEKPSKQILVKWKDQIKNWIDRQSSIIEREFKVFNIGLEDKKRNLVKNFEDFWELVQNAYTNAENYSDFNAFIMSKIVNEIWGYSTLFFRFSECQKILERDFLYLLTEFDSYSNSIKESLISESMLKGGVSNQEFKNIPFWFHCSCGSKARLEADSESNSLIGRGSCFRCGKEYTINFQSKDNPRISEIVSQISARCLSMPLIFFNGLGISCYVGGVAGKDYLEQARHVAERLGLSFCPVVFWRPKDVYSGIGQLAALINFKEISGTSNLSQHTKIKAELKNRFAKIEKEISEIELDRTNVIDSSELDKEERIKILKSLSIKKYHLRRETSHSVLRRNYKLLQNVNSVMRLHSCIIDYAINVGLEKTSKYWLEFLRETKDLSLDVNLKTSYDELLKYI